MAIEMTSAIRTTIRTETEARPARLILESTTVYPEGGGADSPERVRTAVLKTGNNYWLQWNTRMYSEKGYLRNDCHSTMVIDHATRTLGRANSTCTPV